MNQEYFKFNFNKNYSSEDFFISNSNKNAFEKIIKTEILKHIILKGPAKSGKTHLGLLWKNKNNAHGKLYQSVFFLRDLLDKELQQYIRFYYS